MRAEPGCSGLKAGRNTCINNPLNMLAVEKSESRTIKTLSKEKSTHSRKYPFRYHPVNTDTCIDRLKN